VLPELAPYSLDFYYRYHRARGRLSRKVRSFPSFLRGTLETGRLSKAWISPFRRDNQLFHETVRSVVAASESGLILAVGRRDSGLIKELDCFQANVRFVGDKEMSPDGTDYQMPSGEACQVLLYLESADTEAMRRKIEYCLAAMNAKGTLNIVLRLNAGEVSDAHVRRLVFGIGDIFGNRLETLSTQSVGGALMHYNRRFYRQIVDKFVGHYRRFGPITLAWGVPALGLGILFLHMSTLACNINFSLRGPSKQIVRNCSAVVIRAQMWGR
jgi:hypothetical protein